MHRLNDQTRFICARKSWHVDHRGEIRQRSAAVTFAMARCTEASPSARGDEPQGRRRGARVWLIAQVQWLLSSARHTPAPPILSSHSSPALKGKGLSLAKIAGELNKRKVATPRGGKWDHSSVGNVLQRLAA